MTNDQMIKETYEKVTQLMIMTRNLSIKIDKIENRLDKIENRLDKIERTLDVVELETSSEFVSSTFPLEK